jgi:hypothetical protein
MHQVVPLYSRRAEIDAKDQFGVLRGAHYECRSPPSYFVGLFRSATVS